MASLTTRLIPGKKRAPQLLADSTLLRSAFDRLGQSMLSPALAPRLEFRQSLRAELVALAALQASAARPPTRPPKRRKPRSGFRLAALGIGISAAGGGFALAANRANAPELPQLTTTHSAAASPREQIAAPVSPAATQSAVTGTVVPVAVNGRPTGKPSALPTPSAALLSAAVPVTRSPTAAVATTAISTALSAPTITPTPPVIALPTARASRPRTGAWADWHILLPTGLP
jgi:hypothetical protein